MSIAYQIYDMNNDGLVCEVDLFSVVKQTADPLFISIIQSDLKNIMDRVRTKKQINQLFNYNYNETYSLENNYKIGNVRRFLDEREKLNSLNS